MKERRRDRRLPVMLEIELRRGRWEPHLTEDVSKRGLFVRIAGPCPTGQLIQVRIFLPGRPESFEVMAKVARRRSPWLALSEGQLPGVGLEFFCLSGHVLKEWERFIQDTGGLLERSPNCNRYELWQRLKALRESPAETAPVPATRTEEAQDDRTNLIFRVQNVERLEQFMNEELATGQLKLQIPYRMADDTAINLRVIHPRTTEEFPLPGSIRQGGRDGYLIVFDALDAGLIRAFRRYVFSGQAPEHLGGDA